MHSISYIVPTFNNLELLKRCLLSIEKQIENEDTIIIVDDGSNDGTREYLEKQYSENSSVVVLHQSNSGPGQARNTGVSEAKTTYIWFVDSDDFLEDGSSAKVKNALEKSDIDILYINYSKVTKNGILMNSDFLENDFSKQNLLISEHYPWNKIIKTEFMKLYKFPSEKINFEDHAIFPVLISSAKNVKKIDEHLYNYDISHENNLTKKTHKRKDIYSACNYLHSYYLNNQLKYEELELVFIKTFVYSKIFSVDKFSFRETKKNLININSYLDEKTPNWRNSDFLLYKNTKKIRKQIKNFHLKFIVGKVFSMNLTLAYSLIMTINFMSVGKAIIINGRK